MFLGLYNSQIMSQVTVTPNACNNRNVFLNFMESTSFVCRAAIKLTNNTASTTTQWLTFSEVQIYGVK